MDDASSRTRNRRVVGNYTIVRKLGSGSFAQVYEARHARTNETVAVKAISLKKLNRKLERNLESEIAILQKFKHPNIVRLLGLHKTDAHMYLIMELCSGGDLHNYIRKRKKLDEKTIRGFMQQLSMGLKFLWSHNLIHRDLKPQNLLLSSSSPEAVLKIADFGFARHLAVASMAETLCGSPLYMAPEILRLRKYDAKADLWSVGTILFEMLCGRPPFSGRNQIQLLENIETKELRVPPSVSLSDDALLLLKGLLQRNPLLRMSFEEFFSHPFVVQTRRKDRRKSESAEKVDSVEDPSVKVTTIAAIEEKSSCDNGDDETKPLATKVKTTPLLPSPPSEPSSSSSAPSSRPRVARKDPNRLDAKATEKRKAVSKAEERRSVTDSDEYVIIRAKPSAADARKTRRLALLLRAREMLEFDEAASNDARERDTNVSDRLCTTTYKQIKSRLEEEFGSEAFLDAKEKVQALLQSCARGAAASLELKRRIAGAIISLADEKQGRDATGALALYVRGLRTLHYGMVAARNLVPDSTMASIGLSTQALLKEDFKRALKSLRDCRSLVHSDDSSRCVAAHLWFGALSKCRAAAAQELLGSVANSHQGYHDALLLLRALRDDVEVSDDLSKESDLAEICTFSRLLRSRLKAL